MTDSSRSFQDITFTDFLENYPFARKEDHELIRTMLASINTPAGFTAMVLCQEAGEPSLVGVIAQLEPHLADLRARAERDSDALRRLHRLTQVSGALVNAMMGANGFEKDDEAAAMPSHLMHFAKTAATYRAVHRGCA